MVERKDSDDLRGRMPHPISGRAEAPYPVSQSPSSEPADSGHFVQFYETDEFLLETLSGFIVRGLAAGDAIVVVATPGHIEGLEDRLRTRGFDAAPLCASGQFAPLDAADTLNRFIVDELPDRERFTRVIGSILSRAAQGNTHVRVFGEMVALLWERGNPSGAALLEDLWNELAGTIKFSLYCAYPVNDFSGLGQAELLGISAKHDHVLPSETCQ